MFLTLSRTGNTRIVDFTITYAISAYHQGEVFNIM